MAKMVKAGTELTVQEIVIRADSTVIKQAYEARLRIDGLLAEREAAYARIRELEDEVETIVGDEGLFMYPAPPLPIAGFDKPVPASRSVKTAPAKPEPPRQAQPKTSAGNEASSHAVRAAGPQASPPNEDAGKNGEPLPDKADTSSDKSA